MAGLCEDGNEPPGFLKAIPERDDNKAIQITKQLQQITDICNGNSLTSAAGRVEIDSERGTRDKDCLANDRFLIEEQTNTERNYV
ncbi:hypothetical protein ANN_16379 [Periplaneta americana]|uniref:Uncharacterized protein n=1 Tax=Periplaneta americana TaxID=6978 RepID=A0ABQ8SJY2_PERAM|nr:hypothetical protein ANN_16379 [Periplaneta americana]